MSILRNMLKDKKMNEAKRLEEAEDNLRELVQNWGSAMVAAGMAMDASDFKEYYKECLNTLETFGFKHVWSELKETVPSAPAARKALMKAGKELAKGMEKKKALSDKFMNLQDLLKESAKKEEAVVLEGRSSKAYEAWYAANVQIAQATQEMGLKKKGAELGTIWKAIDALIDPALNEEVMEEIELSELTRDMSPSTAFMDAYKELLDADKEISSILKKRGDDVYSQFKKLNDKNHALLKEVKKIAVSKKR